MKRFLIKLIVLLISILLLAYFVQIIVDKGLKKSGLSYYPIWNDILNSKVNADLIIQGNSRAWMQISPYIIDSCLNLNSYNLGINGHTFKMQYFKFLLYLKYNKKPKCIMQSIDSRTTLSEMNELFEFEQFLPYLDNNEVRLAVKEYSFFDERDYYIPMYKYTHSFYSKQLFWEGLKSFIFDSSINQNIYKGFKSSDFIWDEKEFISIKNRNKNGFRVSVDSNTIKYFETFINHCKSQEIKLIFVVTPEFKEYQKYQLNRDSIINLFNFYSQKYNIPILDYSNDSLCVERNNFWDLYHLNTIGVKKFNARLSADLKKLTNF